MVGRLMPGITHNINSPLQIINMQIELFRTQFQKIFSENASKDVLDRKKFMEKGLERFDKMAKSVKDINLLLDNISSRYLKDEYQERTVSPVSILEEEMEFCKSDMFFKHRMEVKRRVSGKKISIKTVPIFIRGVFSSMLFTCIEELKEAGSTPELAIEEEYANNSCKIKFKISSSFPGTLNDDFHVGDRTINLDILSGFSWQQFMLVTAKINATLAGGELILKDNTLTFSYQAGNRR